jgi:hypothetical protein
VVCLALKTGRSQTDMEYILSSIIYNSLMIIHVLIWIIYDHLSFVMTIMTFMITILTCFIHFHITYESSGRLWFPAINCASGPPAIFSLPCVSSSLAASNRRRRCGAAFRG